MEDVVALNRFCLASGTKVARVVAIAMAVLGSGCQFIFGFEDHRLGQTGGGDVGGAGQGGDGTGPGGGGSTSTQGLGGGGGAGGSIIPTVTFGAPSQLSDDINDASFGSARLEIGDGFAFYSSGQAADLASPAEIEYVDFITGQSEVIVEHPDVEAFYSDLLLTEQHLYFILTSPEGDSTLGRTNLNGSGLVNLNTHPMSFNSYQLAGTADGEVAWLGQEQALRRLTAVSRMPACAVPSPIVNIAAVGERVYLALWSGGDILLRLYEDCDPTSTVATLSGQPGFGRALVTDGTDAFIGTSEGIYRLREGETTAEPYSGTSSKLITDIAIDAHFVYFVNNLGSVHVVPRDDLDAPAQVVDLAGLHAMVLRSDEEYLYFVDEDVLWRVEKHFD